MLGSTKLEYQGKQQGNKRWSLLLACSTIAYVIMVVHFNLPKEKLSLRANPSTSFTIETRKQLLTPAEVSELLALGIEILPAQSGDTLSAAHFSPLPKDIHEVCPTSLVPTFTLATTCTTDKLWLLKGICERWAGPISVAVSMYPSQNLLNDSDRSWVSACGTTSPGHGRLRIVPMLVSGSHLQLPINRLRNLAIGAVSTTHHFLIDVDFVPSADLYESLKHLYRNSPQLRSPDVALVVPAFEMLVPPIPNQRVPTPANKSELREQINLKRAAVFHHQLVPDGHSSTPNTAWLPLGCGTAPLSIPCVHSDNYEPYMVLQRCPFTPTYHEGFTGFGKNKIEFTRHVRFAGYSLSVLPCGFIVHNPHPQTQSERYFHGHHKDAVRKRELFADFVAEMSSKSRERVGLCSDESCGMGTGSSVAACPRLLFRFLAKQLHYLFRDVLGVCQ